MGGSWDMNSSWGISCFSGVPFLLATLQREEDVFVARTPAKPVPFTLLRCGVVEIASPRPPQRVTSYMSQSVDIS